MAQGPSPKPHAVVLPLPLQGHLNASLLLSRLLVSKGFTITFVVSEHAYHHTFKDQEQSDGIRVVGIPDHPRGSSLGVADGIPVPSLQASLETVYGMRAGFEHLLEQLGDHAPPVTCFIADMFVLWAHEAAVKFNIPRVVFHTTNAHTLGILCHASSLVSQGVLPFKDNGSGDGPGDFIDSIPFIPPMYAIDFPSAVRTRVEFVLALAEHIHEAAGVLLNTFYEIESRPLDAIRKNLPLYPVGPLLLLCGDTASVTNLGSHWPEEKNCLQWLDTRPPSSVLYVSFGSLASLPPRQVKELAQGLEDSQQAFLWVIRPNSVDGSLSDLLPEGFTERTIHQGLIITWAPQLQVLSHPSVGGFLTHCGWNSVTENFAVGGVPMICWPHFAEQRLNCRLVVDEWKVGMEVRQGQDGGVDKGQVERMVRSLMQGEEGRNMRRRAGQLREMARRAAGEGGSSSMNLEAFVQAMQTPTVKHE